MGPGCTEAGGTCQAVRLGRWTHGEGSREPNSPLESQEEKACEGDRPFPGKTISMSKPNKKKKKGQRQQERQMKGRLTFRHSLGSFGRGQWLIVTVRRGRV